MYVWHLCFEVSSSFRFLNSFCAANSIKNAALMILVLSQKLTYFYSYPDNCAHSFYSIILNIWNEEDFYRRQELGLKCDCYYVGIQDTFRAYFDERIHR
jgi:hypothetical protein